MYDELVNIAGRCKDFETVGMLLTERVTQKSIAYCLERMRDAIKKVRDLNAQSEHNQKRMHWVFYKFSISGQITELNTKFDRLFRELQEDFLIFEKAKQIVLTRLPPEDFLQPVPDASTISCTNS